jgi:hypothetical protein
MVLLSALVFTAVDGIAQSSLPVVVGTRQISGLPDDWTHHRLIYSDPGSERDAIVEGRHAAWLKATGDPRYVLQQLKHQAPARGASAGDVSRAFYLRPPTRESHSGKGSKRDWAVSLGTGTLAQSMFPAKYTFDTSATPSCTGDFVVYGLNTTATTGGQANLVALNELYTGTSSTSCTGYTAAQYYWAYNATTHSGTITTSPVLSLDGKEVMYVESGSSGSYLHILKWYSGDGGTALKSVAPTNAATSLSACTSKSSTASCMITVTLSTSNTTTHSSPFYDYADDILYVGDDSGILRKVTGVLNGTPTLAASLTVSSGNALTSPVYDSTSGNIFVAGGYNLYAVKASTFALETNSALQIGASSCSDGYSNNIMFDGPIVDGSNGWVYEWVTARSSSGNFNYQTAVVQAYTSGTNSPSGSSWTAAEVVNLGNRDGSCTDTGTTTTWMPAFDNAYYNTVTSGHMWVCGGLGSTSNTDIYLLNIPTSGANGLMSGGSGNVTSIDTTSYAQCSPMTEFYNTTTSSDYLFFGEGLSGASGKLYGFNIQGANAPSINGSPVSTYGDATGGTSGIVIDNVSSESQASSIYFATLTTSTSVCGSTSAYCAVKLTQSGLK